MGKDRKEQDRREREAAQKYLRDQEKAAAKIYESMQKYKKWGPKK